MVSLFGALASSSSSAFAAMACHSVVCGAVVGAAMALVNTVVWVGFCCSESDQYIVLYVDYVIKIIIIVYLDVNWWIDR